MKRACADNWENIVELAEGRANPVGQAHVDSCTDCAKALKEMRQLMTASRRGYANAPLDLISRAIGLMPQRAKQRAGLLRTTLGVVGARAEADDFQIVVDLNGQSSRLMYVKHEDGWEVIGKLPTTEWRAEREGEEIPVESGRYSFKAQNLSDTSFDLICNDEAIEVPSAEELLLSGH